MTRDARYPTSIDNVPSATTVSDAVRVAELLGDEIGDVEAFIDIARTAYINAHSRREVSHADLDVIEERARNAYGHSHSDNYPLRGGA